MIGLVGSIGKGKKTSSGQEIRTSILLQSLYDHYGESEIQFVDTGSIEKSKISFVISFIKCLLSCKDIILIVSRNGLKVFLPILYSVTKLFGKRIYNNIIGGNITELIDQNPKYIKYMKGFVVNWVQMPRMVESLNRLGIRNVDLLPNSKPIQIASGDEYELSYPLRFCTFSRISKAKGIELAVEVIQRINREKGYIVATLDIYGVPDAGYEKRLDELIASASNCVNYKGVVKYDKSSIVLSKYFMLLFPTTFVGEGFPGTIIDAYAAGLPVLASDWKFNPDLIKQGITGLLYNHNQEIDLYSNLIKLIEDPKKIVSMRKNCIIEAEKYTPDKVMPIIFAAIDSKKEKKNGFKKASN